MKGNPPKPDPRDRDLITVDSILGDEALDKLWDWYCMATANNLDPQMVFVKFVNSIRKPYVEKLEHQQRTFFPYGGGSMATPSGYTPSEAGTVIGDYESRTDPHHDPFNLIEAPLIHLEHKPDSELEPHDHDHVDSDGHDLGPNTEKAKDMLGSIVIPPRILQPTRIAIKAADFPNSFVQLKGDRITSFLSGGGGSAHVAGGISDTEIFELERLEHGIVAFKSIKHHNVYLRADPQGLKPGEFRMWGGGVVNCQYSCGKHERFRITKAGEGGQVAIEPEEFPGTYLRVNGMGSDGINLQGTRSGWERFFLVLVI